MPIKLRVGELLVKNNIITESQLSFAMDKQQASGGKLGTVLIELGYIEEDTFLNFLAEQLQIPFVDLRHFSLNPKVIHELPEAYARRFRSIVLSEDDAGYMVGMVDPQDLFACDEIAHLLTHPIRFAIVRELDLLQAIDTNYRRTEEITNFAQELSLELHDNDYDIMKLDNELPASDVPVVKLLRSIFEDAVQMDASDIHIEPDENLTRIRQRIDGVLYENIVKEQGVATAMTSRLKLMGGLNITEKRLPQDGRFSIKIKNKNFDVRLSTMPTEYGESVVLRLLNQSNKNLFRIDQIGFPEPMLKYMQKIISLPHGMLLATGPTGSGKTTTLFGVLNELNTPDVNIITIEDPVEYRLPRINQVQVNPKVDLTFARVLRASLRQDPDIIMIGEIRDQETASIALRSAITGHFVLATLHTNDAISTIIRLIDIGAESYLLGSALRAVIAQRLLRKVCKNCSKEYTISVEEKSWLEEIAGMKTESTNFKKGLGCSHCNGSGYRGRIAVFELLEFTSAVVSALRKNDPEHFSQVAKEHLIFGSLAQNALAIALSGETSIEEVIRIAGLLEA